MFIKGTGINKNWSQSKGGSQRMGHRQDACFGRSLAKSLGRSLIPFGERPVTEMLFLGQSQRVFLEIPWGVSNQETPLWAIRIFLKAAGSTDSGEFIVTACGEVIS